MAAISSARAAGASTLLLLSVACGGHRQSATQAAAPAAKALPPRPLGEVFVLEAAGAQPDDTTLRIDPGIERVIVLRRSAPDFGLFARIELGDSALQGDSALGITIRPLPGEYGLDLVLRGEVGKGGAIVFSYGSHFVAPAGARARYGSDIYFERALAIGKLDEHEQLVFLPTTRPGSDMLSATLAGPGRYLVAAPR